MSDDRLPPTNDNRHAAPLKLFRSWKNVMPQIVDPVPDDATSKITCCYVNATSKMQVARITNVPNWYFERVVFPGQHLIFEAVASAQLEIHTGLMASSILSDTISCVQLQIEDGETPLPHWIPKHPVGAGSHNADP